MSLLKKLTTDGSPLSNLNGRPGPKPDFKNSKLHNTYSLDGDPNVANKPSPSNLDLNGEVPSTNYRKNTPEGRTF